MDEVVETERLEGAGTTSCDSAFAMKELVLDLLLDTPLE